MLIKIKYQWIITINRHKDCYYKLSELKHCLLNKRTLFQATDKENENGWQSHKYCGIIDWRQSKELFNIYDFTDTMPTMGAITLETGTLPAISFDVYFNDYSIHAYVSPLIPDDFNLDMLPERQQELIHAAINRKCESVLTRLENYLDTNDLPKAFRIDINQLEFDLPF